MLRDKIHSYFLCSLAKSQEKMLLFGNVLSIFYSEVEILAETKVKTLRTKCILPSVF